MKAFRILAALALIVGGIALALRHAIGFAGLPPDMGAAIATLGGAAATSAFVMPD